MQDRSINNALLALRKQIIRGNGPGLAHVEALLQMRGVGLPRVIVRKAPPAKRGAMRLLIQDALRDGPKTLGQIGAHVVMHRPELGLRAARKRASQVLAKMKAAGMVVCEGTKWTITASF